MKRRLARIVIIPWIAMTTCTVLAPAWAYDVEAEHERGRKLRALGRDDEALAVFRSIYDKSQEPRALARMGLAEEALARWVDAEEHLVLALLAGSDPWIRDNRASLEQRLSIVRSHLGNLVVTTNVTDASLLIDGRNVGTLPLAKPLRVVAGALELEVRTRSGAFARRRVVVAAGTEIPAPIVIAIDRESPKPPAPAPSGRSIMRPLAIGGFAVGGALVGLSVVSYALGSGRVRDFNAAGCVVHEGTVTGPPTAPCGRLFDEVSLWGGLALGGAISGGLLLAASTSLWLLAPSRPARAVAVGCSPTYLGVSCQGTF